MSIKKKSQKQKIFEHIQLVGQATVAETAKALGLPRGSVGRAEFADLAEV